jgi:hypothetical protein
MLMVYGLNQNFPLASPFLAEVKIQVAASAAPASLVAVQEGYTV